MRIAIYARVSTDDKDQDPEVQLMKCRTYCELHNHKVLGEFRDEGVSGDTLIWERPGGSKAKELIDSGRAEGLVVFSVDRYSRQSPIKVLQQLAYLKESGVKFISITEPPFNMDSEFAEPLQYMLTWFANWFLVQHKKKVRAGIDKAKETGTKSGKAIGRPKLSGWHRNRIIEMRKENPRITIREIAKELKLSRGVVHKTLQNLAEEKDPPQTGSPKTISFMDR